MKYLKSAVILLTRQKSITPESGLSNEILCILVAQVVFESALFEDPL